VVVASTAIARGASLQPNMLKVVNYPADSVPAGAFTNINQVSGNGPTARLALNALEPNEPLMATKVSGPGGKTTLSVTLTPGMRAIAMRSNEVTGVGGFVLPGDRVDVIWTRQIGPSDAEVTVSQVVAEDVRVLGVDQSDDNSTDKPTVTKSLTLEVTPDQAQGISLAQSVGTVSLALRQIADDGPLLRKATTLAQFGRFGAPRPGTPTAVPATSPAGAPVIHGPQIRVFRGVEMTSYPVKVR
jgi:pilus assembly protein CpaB